MISPLTVQQLLASPKEFDGITVEVTGVLVNEREHRAIYESESSIGSYEGIWLADPTAIVGGPKTVGLLNRKRIRIVGVFRNRKNAGAGHLRMWPAELGKIIVLEDAPSGT